MITVFVLFLFIDILVHHKGIDNVDWIHEKNMHMISVSHCNVGFMNKVLNFVIEIKVDKITCSYFSESLFQVLP